MNKMKVTLAVAALLVLTRYFPVYYTSNEYSEFVRNATTRARSESQLKQSLLDQAQQYSLPVKDSDISFNKKDGVLRVTVDYSVPVNLFVVNPALKFHASASGAAPILR